MWEPTRSQNESVEWWQGVVELMLTGTGEWRRRISKLIGLPTEAAEAKQSLKDLMVELQRVPGTELVLQGIRELPPASYDDSQWRVLVALIRLLPLVVFELERSFSRRGLTDFVEVARAASITRFVIFSSTKCRIHLSPSTKCYGRSLEDGRKGMVEPCSASVIRCSPSIAFGMPKWPSS